MTKLTSRIKLRLSLNLSKDDLGLVRLYNELAAIEGDSQLSADDISEAKRRHLLGILYQYSHVAMSPFPSSMAVAPAAFATTLDLAMVTPIGATSRELIVGREIQAIPVPVAKASALDGMNALSEKALNDSGMGFVDTNPSS